MPECYSRKLLFRALINPADLGTGTKPESAEKPLGINYPELTTQSLSRAAHSTYLGYKICVVFSLSTDADTYHY